MVKRYRIHIAIALLVALVAAYLIVINRDNPLLPVVSRVSEEMSGSERVLPDGSIEYRNEMYGFTLAYPQELTRKEFDEGNGAITITFSGKKEREGFQLFIVPYASSQIDTERFLLDVPSGVMEEPIDVLIDGVRATAFFSSNSIMGDTREVWFINKGYLYEVVTYKEHDAWLAGIMRGWKWLGPLETDL